MAVTAVAEACRCSRLASVDQCTLVAGEAVVKVEQHCCYLAPLGLGEELGDHEEGQVGHPFQEDHLSLVALGAAAGDAAGPVCMSLPLLPLWEVLVEAAEEALNQYQEVLISLPQIYSFHHPAVSVYHYGSP